MYFFIFLASVWCEDDKYKNSEKKKNNVGSECLFCADLLKFNIYDITKTFGAVTSKMCALQSQWINKDPHEYDQSITFIFVPVLSVINYTTSQANTLGTILY